MNDKMDKCVLCGERPTTAVRGNIEKEYVNLCSYHAGALQMIFEKVGVSNSVKWKPLFEKHNEKKVE